MDGPERVRLKRRADEPPPDRLIVEQRGSKRVFTGQGYAGGLYVREAHAGIIPHTPPPKEDVGQPLRSQGQIDQSLVQDLKAYAQDSKVNDKYPASKIRTFHLKRPALQEPEARKRRTKQENIATFVEHGSGRDAVEHRGEVASAESTQPRASTNKPQKRPGRGAAVKRLPPDSATSDPTHKESGTPGDQVAADALANRLHRAALEELAHEPKPKITSLPRLPPQRSREIHQARVAARTAESVRAPLQEPDDGMDLDRDSAAYVYDTYVLAPTQDNAIAFKEEALVNIGYLVITSEDQDLWETYMQDNHSEEGDYNSDEDDENAEDYYGADYPDDELASDDEHDRGAYGYRANAGSDNEQWNADETSWSDDEDIRMRNPFAKQVGGSMGKYLNRTHDVVDDNVGM